MIHICVRLHKNPRRTKGYTEVLVDSDGEHHGQGLGEVLSAESDALKVKYQRRAQLRAMAKNTRNARKRRNIIQHNLAVKNSSAAQKRRPQISATRCSKPSMRSWIKQRSLRQKI
jgi:hypothetical protein